MVEYLFDTTVKMSIRSQPDTIIKWLAITVNSVIGLKPNILGYPGSHKTLSDPGYIDGNLVVYYVFICDEAI